MLLNILLVIQIIVSVALVGVVLLQRSEGGALGMGGGPSGFMTARGAGNLLTKITWTLGTLFFVCAIALSIAGNLAQDQGSSLSAEDVGTLAPVSEAPSAPQPQAPAGPSRNTPSLDDLPVAGSTVPSGTEPAPAQ